MKILAIASILGEVALSSVTHGALIVANINALVRPELQVDLTYTGTRLLEWLNQIDALLKRELYRQELLSTAQGITLSAECRQLATFEVIDPNAAATLTPSTRSTGNAIMMALAVIVIFVVAGVVLFLHYFVPPPTAVIPAPPPRVSNEE